MGGLQAAANYWTKVVLHHVSHMSHAGLELKYSIEKLSIEREGYHRCFTVYVKSRVPWVEIIRYPSELAKIFTVI